MMKVLILYSDVRTWQLWIGKTTFRLMTLNSDEHNTQQVRVFNRLILRNKWFNKLFKCFNFVFLFPEFPGFHRKSIVHSI